MLAARAGRCGLPRGAHSGGHPGSKASLGPSKPFKHQLCGADTHDPKSADVLGGFQSAKPKRDGGKGRQNTATNDDLPIQFFVLPFLFLQTELELQLPLLAARFACRFSPTTTILILPSWELPIALPLPSLVLRKKTFICVSVVVAALC